MPAVLGLVTVLFKSDDVLEGFCRSLHRQTYSRYRLYIIDNSPNERTEQVLADLGRQYPLAYVEHIRSPGNIGVAAGNNAGIRKALADGCTHVVLLNNDIEFEQDFLLEKLTELVTEKGEKLAVPKIYYYDTRRIWMAGGHIDKWRALGVHEGYGQPDGPAYDKGKYIGYAPTCFMIVAREVFESVGIMDEQYFAYYDDVDFVARALRAGYKLWYEPSLTVLHKVSSSSGGDESPFYIYYSNRNKLYYIRKNQKGVFRVIPVMYLLLSRIVFWLRYNRTGKKKLVQGIRDGFRLRPSAGGE